MKKRMLFGVISLIMAMVLCTIGCGGETEAPTEEEIVGNFGETGKSLYLYKDLAVQDVMTADFDTSDLDLSEYRGLLDTEIAEYNKTADLIAPTGERGENEPAFTDPVTVVKCEVKDNKLNQQLIYANAKDFTAYNEAYLKEIGGSYIKCGTLASVDTEILKTNFVNEKGDIVDVQSLCIDSKAGNYRYIIADFDCHIYGDGKVFAFARGMEYTKNRGSVATGEAKLSIVIFNK